MSPDRASPKTRRSAKAGTEAARDLLNRSRLPSWIVRALKANRLRRLSELSALSDAELLRLDGIGQRALSLIRAEIARAKTQCENIDRDTAGRGAQLPVSVPVSGAVSVPVSGAIDGDGAGRAPPEPPVRLEA